LYLQYIGPAQGIVHIFSDTYAISAEKISTTRSASSLTSPCRLRRSTALSLQYIGPAFVRSLDSLVRALVCAFVRLSQIGFCQVSATKGNFAKPRSTALYLQYIGPAQGIVHIFSDTYAISAEKIWGYGPYGLP
jgi:hypothetical protein